VALQPQYLFWITWPVVSKLDQDCTRPIVVVDPDGDGDLRGVALVQGVLDGVGRQLVDHQRQVMRLVGRYPDRGRGYIYGHALTAWQHLQSGLDEANCQVAQRQGRPPGGGEHIVHRGQALHPVDQILHHEFIGCHVLCPGAASFGVQQADDGGQVVLDPVIDLAQQHRLGLGVSSRLLV